MGTKLTNRFHPAGDTEETRLATQVIPVHMDAPNSLGGLILDPNLKPGSETFAQIAIGDADTPAPSLPTADQVSISSAVGQLHADLVALKPEDPADVAKLVAQDTAVVPAMASRDTLPKADAAMQSQSVDVNVQFANAEAYVDQRNLRVGSSGAVTFAITNLDGVDRHFDVRQLRNRSKIDAQGVLSWGAFNSNVIGSGVDVPANTTVAVTYKVSLADDAFSLWVGDPNGGSQAGWAIALDRGPRKQSLEMGLGPVKPLHEALDSSGKLWVTLANTDEIARLSPGGGEMSTADPEVFPLPGGINDPDPKTRPDAATILAGPVFGPGDVQIDSHGIAWVTLGVGNAIARIDPQAVKDGKTQGIKIIRLKACTEVTCRKAPVPVPAAAPLSRIPLQLRVWEDGGENTVIVFTEQNADSIGILRVDKDGNKLNEAHVNCRCLQPLGIALDPSGDVWFSEGSSNRLGRMTLDPTAPFSAVPSLAHYNIPGAVCEAVPGQKPNGDPACATPTGPLPPLVLPNPALTTLPHSVAVDRKGRVWYTGEASERVGYLDPAKAQDGTGKGFEDAPGPKNEFGRVLAPADMAIDADGKVFFSDEYGDQIATATVDDTGQIHPEFAFRPNARNSLTDSPLIDPSGNLWFLEAGAEPDHAHLGRRRRRAAAHALADAHCEHRDRARHRLGNVDTGHVDRRPGVPRRDARRARRRRPGLRPELLDDLAAARRRPHRVRAARRAPAAGVLVPRRQARRWRHGRRRRRGQRPHRHVGARRRRDDRGRRADRHRADLRRRRQLLVGRSGHDRNGLLDGRERQRAVPHRDAVCRDGRLEQPGQRCADPSARARDACGTEGDADARPGRVRDRSLARPHRLGRQGAPHAAAAGPDRRRRAALPRHAGQAHAQRRDRALDLPRRRGARAAARQRSRGGAHAQRPGPAERAGPRGGRRVGSELPQGARHARPERHAGLPGGRGRRDRPSRRRAPRGLLARQGDASERDAQAAERARPRRPPAPRRRQVSNAATTIAQASARRPRLARAVLLAVVSALGVAASALAFGALWPNGSSTVAPPQPVRLSRSDAAAARAVVDRARRLTTLTPAQLGYTLRVAGPVAGLRGQTDNATRTITLFVSPNDMPNVVAHDLAHEIGHAYDAQRMTAAQRAAYLRARGVRDAPWLPGAQASDYRSGAGDFAEVFALCHAASPVYRSRLASRPADPCGALPKDARAAKLGEGGS